MLRHTPRLSVQKSRPPDTIRSYRRRSHLDHTHISTIVVTLESSSPVKPGCMIGGHTLLAAGKASQNGRGARRRACRSAAVRPCVVQSMTMTDTADAAATAQQCIELAEAGSEMVRITVNLPEAARAVPEIKQRMLDAGVTAPLIGDFHYNGHLLLTKHPDCATALDKYRINPGNVGTGRRRDEQFATICKVAQDNGRPVRIGVNGGSLNQELVVAKMQENTDRDLGLTSEEIINECMILSALQSTELALESGLRKDQIIISCKTSRPRDLICRLSRPREANRSAAASRADRGRNGHERARVVRVRDGRAAQRRHRRHDPRVADAAARRRSPRGSLRGVRAAAGARHSLVLAERHRMSRLRADDQQRRSRSWPSERRNTFASGCPTGRPATTASKP